MDLNNQDKKNTIGKISSFIVVVIIVLLIGYLVINNNDTRLDEKKHSIAIQDLEENEENNQNKEILGIDDEINDDMQDSVEETIENVDTSDVNRKIIVFKDKNHNALKEDDEEICDICVGKYINAVSLSGGTVYPSNENFLEIPIQGGGLINEDKINTTNHVWGFFSDREVIIPHTDIFLGDGVGDLYLPAWEYSVAMSGSNSMMKKGKIIKDESGGYEVKYIFNDLLPILSEKYKKEEDIYVYFIPNKDKLGTGYLVKSNIQKESDNYFINLVWSFTNMFNDVLEPENLTVVVL